MRVERKGKGKERREGQRGKDTGRDIGAETYEKRRKEAERNRQRGTDRGEQTEGRKRQRE